MEYEKIIFFRNFFFRAFIIGLAFALFYFIATYVFWDTWASWATHFFKTDEKELGRLVLMFFVELRLVLVFCFLCQLWLCIGWPERCSDWPAANRLGAGLSLGCFSSEN